MSGAHDDHGHHHREPESVPRSASARSNPAGREEARLERGGRPHRRRLRGGHRPAQRRQVVARAWVDPAYRARLLADGTAWAIESSASAASTSRWSRTPAGPQSRGLHALLLLSARADPGCRPSGTSPSSTARARCASRAGPARVRVVDLAGDHGDSHLGLERRASLSRTPGASGRHRASERGRAGQLVTRDSMIGVAWSSRRPRRAEGEPRGTRPEPRDRRHEGRRGAAEKERRARLRRGVARGASSA